MDDLENQATAPPEREYLPAPHGLRAAALIIDCLIVVLVVLVMPGPLRYLLPLTFFIVYHTVLIWLVQQTAGKALFGLRVDRIGKKPGLLWALGRASLGYFIVDVLGVGGLAALFNRHHRCVHDYVFGTVVVFQGPSAIPAKGKLDRLLEFAERQISALKEKQKPIAALVAFWAFLAGLARTLKRLIDSLAGSPDPAPSIAGALSLKAAVIITAAATAISATVVIYVPPVRYVAEWLIAPRYFLVIPLPKSAFDNGDEGWTVVGDAQGKTNRPNYVSPGGNPGGYISAKDDAAGEVWYWQAPKKFLGDLSAAYGGTLTFDLKQSHTDSQFDAKDIILASEKFTLVFDTSKNPGTDWTHYSIKLDESAGWKNKANGQLATRTDMLAVLSSLTTLWVRGEYHVGPDTGGLDNVAFSK